MKSSEKKTNAIWMRQDGGCTYLVTGLKCRWKKIPGAKGNRFPSSPVSTLPLIFSSKNTSAV